MKRLYLFLLFISISLFGRLSTEDHLALHAAAKNNAQHALLIRYLSEGKINDQEFLKWSIQYKNRARPKIFEAYSGYVPEPLDSSKFN